MDIMIKVLLILLFVSMDGILNGMNLSSVLPSVPICIGLAGMMSFVWILIASCRK